MNRRMLIITGSSLILTILFAIAYIIFNVLGITLSHVKIYQVTIVTESAEKYYDGTELSHFSWYIETGNLIEGHTIEFHMQSTLTNPGTIKNGIGITIYDIEQQNVTDDYKINFKLGDLTVHPREIFVQTSSSEKDYDGTPISLASWNLVSGTLLSNHHMEYVMTSSMTNVGSISNQIGITIFDEFNQVVTHYYQIHYDLGSLTVHPLNLTIKSESATKVYDGTPLIREDWELLFGNLLDNHQLIVDVESEITDIGSTENHIYAYVIDQFGNNVSDLYQFEYVEGTLTVLTSAYGSGDIAKESFDLTDEDVFKFYTTQEEHVYFRAESWGNYNYLGWDTGLPYEGDINLNPLLYAGITLQESAYQVNMIQIEYLRDFMPYLVPYFHIDHLVTKNDVYIEGSRDGITQFNHIAYQYQELDPFALQNPSYVTEELIYREFVYDYYLNIPFDTRQALLMLAEENDIDVTSSSLVTDIQTYIKQAAVYNLEFESIPDDVLDIAIYFLTVSKEGICQHYATAATLMYRAFGIPARYVTGYLGISKINDWSTVTGRYAHAWVEIYLDGFGWIPIEVTAGGPSTEEPGTELPKITVLPASVIEPYETGKVIQPHAVSIRGFRDYIANGYTYDVTFSGELSIAGRSNSYITSIVIYDSLGNDVTDQFDITLKSGVLQLYLFEIDLITVSDQKTYDGTSLINHLWSIDGLLDGGHYVESVVFSGEQTNVGSSENKAVITIYDASGDNVTSLYKINQIFGDLVVTPRSIVVESSSSTKVYDGTKLMNHAFSILVGSLVNGETIEITITGEQTSIGRSTNTIESITIWRDGMDVTRNYSIEMIEGDLIVSPN